MLTTKPKPIQFNGLVFKKALEYYGLPEHYNRIFKQEILQGGGTALVPTSARLSSEEGVACWVQMNLPSETFQVRKARNQDIDIILNVTLDFEYPSNPVIAHTLGLKLAERLIDLDFAAKGVPVENSGAGCHIVLPVKPFKTSDYWSGTIVNKAVASVVRRFIKPIFEELAGELGVQGEINLEGFDISRILSAPGTYRPYNPSKNDTDSLKSGVIRSWLNYDEGQYPVRKESEILTATIQAECLDVYEAEEEALKRREAVANGTYSPSVNYGRKVDAVEWITAHAQRKQLTGDKSRDFHSLVTATLIRFDEETVLHNAILIDELTGGKYKGREETEAQRCMDKDSVQNLKAQAEISKLQWKLDHQKPVMKFDTKPPASQKFNTEQFKPVKSDGGNNEPPSNSGNGGNNDDNSELPEAGKNTDSGNGERFASICGENARIVPEIGWFIWDGVQWKKDETSQILELAKKTACKIFEEASHASSTDKYLEMVKFGIKSLSVAALKNMLEAAEPKLAARTDNFDNQDWLLNCKNGTVNLRTGELLDHNRDHMLTKAIKYKYNPAAKAPHFQEFIKRIMNDDMEMVSFLQRALGYSLTGSTREHVFFLCYGSGRNGKSTLLETIANILGEYSETANFTTFLEKANESISNDVAKLVGSRLVTVSEANPGKYLNEALIKGLTSGDKISARFMRKEYFTFTPKFKMWFATNHKPRLKGTDNGIGRRINLIPFDVVITDEEVDKDLGEKLLKEAEGILAWMVEGCLLWQKEGLKPPVKVLEATKDYREANDVLAEFLKEHCEFDSISKVEFQPFFKLYTDFSTENGDQILGKKTFAERLEERPNIKIKEGAGNKRFIIGLKVKEEYQHKLKK